MNIATLKSATLCLGAGLRHGSLGTGRRIASPGFTYTNTNGTITITGYTGLVGRGHPWHHRRLACHQASGMARYPLLIT